MQAKHTNTIKQIPKLSKTQADKLWQQYKADHQSMQLSRPAKGVKMVQFDEFGFKKGLGDYRKVFDVGNIDKIPEHEITDPAEGLDVGVKYYPPPDDVVIPQYVKDVDLEFEKMNQEQRAVFECLDNEEMIDAYDDLDDDFVIEANQKMPALEVLDVQKKKVRFEDQVKVDDVQDQSNNVPKKVKGLMTADELAFLNQKEKEEQRKFQKILKEDYDSNGDDDDDDEDEDDQEYEDYNDDDDNDEEQYYCVDRPGEKLESRNFNAIIEEYLQQKKIPRKLLQATLPKKEVLFKLVDEQDVLKEKKQLKENVLRLVAQQLEEQHHLGSDDQDPSSLFEQQAQTEESQNKKWDIQTVQSTFTNTENHPSIIQSKFIDPELIKMLTKKDIPRKLMEKILKMKKIKKQNKVEEVQEKVQQNTESLEVCEDVDVEQNGKNQLSGKQLKKLNKKKVKQQKKQRREAKKANKLAFKQEEKKLLDFNVNPNNFAPGLSVKKIN